MSNKEQEASVIAQPRWASLVVDGLVRMRLWPKLPDPKRLSGYRDSASVIPGAPYPEPWIRYGDEQIRRENRKVMAAIRWKPFLRRWGGVWLGVGVVMLVVERLHWPVAVQLVIGLGFASVSAAWAGVWALARSLWREFGEPRR